LKTEILLVYGLLQQHKHNIIYNYIACGELVILLPRKNDSNMKKTTLEIIQERAEQAKGIRTAVIEHNLELPEHDEITEKEFFGVRALRNDSIKKGTANLTYTM